MLVPVAKSLWACLRTGEDSDTLLAQEIQGWEPRHSCAGCPQEWVCPFQSLPSQHFDHPEPSQPGSQAVSEGGVCRDWNFKVNCSASTQKRSAPAACQCEVCAQNFDSGAKGFQTQNLPRTFGPLQPRRTAIPAADSDR